MGRLSPLFQNIVSSPHQDMAKKHYLSKLNTGEFYLERIIKMISRFTTGQYEISLPAGWAVRL